MKIIKRKDLLVTDLDLLKSAYSEKDLERITESTEKLNATWATISTKMYQESTPEEPVAESPDDIQKMLNMKMV
jgi:citrate synthase